MTDTAELLRRIERLERFIVRNSHLWDEAEPMLEESSLTETVLDTISHRVWLSSPELMMDRPRD